jgi:hypothetical protein
MPWRGASGPNGNDVTDRSGRVRSASGYVPVAYPACGFFDGSVIGASLSWCDRVSARLTWERL